MFLKNSTILKFFPFVLIFYEVTNYLATDMYIPALPNIVQDFNIDAYTAQLTLTLWFIGSASLQLFIGPLADHYGRRPILFSGAFVFIIATLSCVIAPTINILLVGRFFQGCAICTIATAGYSAIHELYAQKHVIKILAVMASITVFAPAFGPLIGSIILQWLSWRWIFAILGIWAIIGLGMLYYFMPETNTPEKRYLFNFKAIINNYLKIFFNLKFTLNILVFCLIFTGMVAWITAGPFLIMTTFKFSAVYFGIFQFMIFSCLVIGAQAMKNALTRMSPAKLINTGLVIIFISSIFSLAFALLYPSFIYNLLLELMIYTFAASWIMAATNRIAIEACIEPMGARMAVFSTFMGLSGFFSSFFTSITYNGTLFWFSALIFWIAILAGLARIIVIKFYN